ncbi:glycosyltransferase family 2 protein [uncultured Brachyspira sp.]|uniref:glycosyltransferase family 2 protein n=1 Tax=uncultured Brachyspira sp. TaxID=221953 RepID=UPI0026287C54|nr:glycosyltransferase family 2 protein [uncultured Brachyspira sp.]
MIKISVIIPVYNVELYLKECLDSIINQTLKNIEIICIDDNSTDNSYNILLEYQKIDNRIKIIKHKENLGLGPARNSGIRAAKGEYIYFIDSDDYISTNYINSLYESAMKYKSDMIGSSNLYIISKEKEIFPFFMFRIDEWKEKYPNNYLEGISHIGIKDLLVESCEHLGVTAWNKIYKRDFIIKNNLFFMDIHSGEEDVDFYYRILINEPSIAYNHSETYFYRKRENSLMEKAKTDIDIFKYSIEHYYYTIDYCKNKNIKLLEDLYIRLWESAIARFELINYKEESYKYLYKFSKDIHIKSNISKDLYDKFINCKLFDSYEDYIYSNNKILKLNNHIHSLENHIHSLENHIATVENYINTVENNINNNYQYFDNLIDEVRFENNIIKLFGLYAKRNYIAIIMLGIKITIRINNEKINKLAWWIPIRKWRNNFRNRLIG